MALSSKREARRRASGSRISRHQSYSQLSPAYDSLPNVSFGAVHDICTPQHLSLKLIAKINNQSTKLHFRGSCIVDIADDRLGGGNIVPLSALFEITK